MPSIRPASRHFERRWHHWDGVRKTIFIWTFDGASLTPIFVEVRPSWLGCRRTCSSPMHRRALWHYRKLPSLSQLYLRRLTIRCFYALSNAWHDPLAILTAFPPPKWAFAGKGWDFSKRTPPKSNTSASLRPRT